MLERINRAVKEVEEREVAQAPRHGRARRPLPL
jgi:hypothetical protein